ncbi:hypothetical protein JCM14076_17680 [Methylosoma difficile]
MKSLAIKTLTSSLLLIAAGYTGMASAHCLNETLGASAIAADLYRISCLSGDGSDEAPSLLATRKLAVQPNKVSGNNVTVQIGREGFTPSSQSTDSSTGTAINLATCTAPSLGTQVTLDPVAQGAADGNGDYNILVNKNGSTATSYGLVFHCQDAAGVHTTTQEVVAGSAAPELAGNTAISPDIDIEIDN